ncbi:MAG: ATP-dependent zinc metalloprotease FtsH, partial [Ruminiclostridium sp.]|nr:ATP-dependent zinc metalloprotease FtsH [Ruminiclostridium sp.]
MQSNKFKGIIIYIVIIALLVCGLIAILNSIAPRSGDGKLMAWNKTYSELLDEFDKLNVKWYELDLGSGQLDFRTKDTGDESKYRYSVPNVSLFVNDVADYRVRYNAANPDKTLEFDYKPITDNS